MKSFDENESSFDEISSKKVEEILKTFLEIIC